MTDALVVDMASGHAMSASRIWIFVLLSAVLVTGSGCLSTNSKRFTKQVERWAPRGITVAQATNAMQRHGFSCEYQRFNTNSWAWWEDFDKNNHWKRELRRRPWPGDVVRCYRRSE